MRIIGHFFLYTILLSGIFSECLAKKQPISNGRSTIFSNLLDKKFYRLCEEKNFQALCLLRNKILSFLKNPVA